MIAPHFRVKISLHRCVVAGWLCVTNARFIAVNIPKAPGTYLNLVAPSQELFWHAFTVLNLFFAHNSVCLDRPAPSLPRESQSSASIKYHIVLVVLSECLSQAFVNAQPVSIVGSLTDQC